MLEAARSMERPRFIFHVRNADGAGRLRVRRAGSASASRRGGRVRLAGTVENPLVGGRYSLDVYIREEDEQGGDDRAGPAAAALRGRGDAAGGRHGLGAQRRRGGAGGGRPSERRDGAPPRRPRALGARRRLAPRARAALPAGGHRLQEALLRDGVRLPVVDRAAAAAVRRAARRLHAGLPDRLGGAATTRCCCCSTSCCSASSRRPRASPSPRSSPRRGSCARRSSRAW